MWPKGKGPVLCLVTDRRRLGAAASDDVQPLLDLVAAAADAGIDFVQIREPDLSDRALVRLVQGAVAVSARSETRILVNERFDIALAGGAAGVHLKGSSPPAEQIRAQIPPGWILGRSVHDLAEARRVTASAALDYVVLGTLFATSSKPGRVPITLDPLRQAVEALAVPVLGIGGIGPEQLPEVARTGAAGIAAIGLFADLFVNLQKSSPQVFRQSVDKIRKRWGM